MKSIVLTTTLLACVVLSSAATQWYSATLSGSSCTVTSGRNSVATAYASISDQVNSTGWAFLSVTTNPQFSDHDQAFAAGCLEGRLTWQDIYASWPSFLQANGYPGGNLQKQATAWMQSNFKWMEHQIASYPSDPYWVQVGLVVAQLKGMAAGYASVAPTNQMLTVIDMMMLNSDGDLDDLNNIFTNVRREDMPPKELVWDWTRKTHCSVLVKVTDDLSDLLVAHTTWSSFTYMLRYYKSYDLKFSVNPSVISFSSYPAYIGSVDDWYITSNNLVVTETTNGFMDSSLNHWIRPESLMSWVRAAVANRVAKSGAQWVDMFSLYNSGTYNNQWIVVDYNLFTPKQPIKAGTLWIVEQMPGELHKGDVSQTLAFGYWPSYNIPYFPDIFNKSGFPGAVKKVGVWFDYSLAPRAKIFRRDNHKVQSLEDMLKMIRYNDWQHDKFSNNNPSNAISSRMDLVTVNDPQNPYTTKAAFGSIDGKATSYALMKTKKSMVQSGPTHDQQPPFSWDAWPSIPHIGQPTVFNFPWVLADFPSNQ